MIVICLEGCHGVGKTMLISQFKKAGFQVLDEAFMEMPEYALHPQTLVMETVWLSNWFMRLLKMTQTVKDHDSTIFIADRSPYSAEFYAPHGHLLGPVIKEQIEELKTKNIYIYTVLINVDKELLWKRILERLEREPHRVKYNEHSREWMEKTYNWYKTHEWDFCIDNGEWGIDTTQIVLMKKLSSYAREHDFSCWEHHGLFHYCPETCVCG
ncbi:uncharacterized protein MONOS_1815 [Monocercomonoides exilis]|uniref:uncharacterized protein n=1 Tax=Monocercomonoides exilis TaxID=2049356 RepID=UPI003559E779|nr:hypothetical protein MONOS_1815 [Monocercomonoides exilis]|eukprot:MONOS_1815.1-p1 / transcript=MONOS_1815.1 / gene=MONOS_1815 / organism=Monocercomonoides_exilis_PA203 / gene_product=hypothetical protein H310_03832 / transcript_product=hypothetical protein H310_03832 / location=Mono_scaffold00034:87730-88419(-) / protein_length=211 / sequence_SO=supercontig / SO=protein_coding / is_pseudo=false